MIPLQNRCPLRQNKFHLPAAEALAGYLGHWAGRYGNLDDDVERAQQILTLALGLRTDGAGYTMREGEMTAAAIAQMLGRVLVVDLLADEEAP